MYSKGKLCKCSYIVLNSPITHATPTGSPWVRDTSLLRTKFWFPTVSVLERFHCTCSRRLLSCSSLMWYSNQKDATAWDFFCFGIASDKPGLFLSPSTTPQPASVGINRMWVSARCRRKGVASKLLDSVRWVLFRLRTMPVTVHTVSEVLNKYTVSFNVIGKPWANYSLNLPYSLTLWWPTKPIIFTSMPFNFLCTCFVKTSQFDYGKL